MAMFILEQMESIAGDSLAPWIGQYLYRDDLICSALCQRFGIGSGGIGTRSEELTDVARAWVVFPNSVEFLLSDSPSDVPGPISPSGPAVLIAAVLRRRSFVDRQP
jgi:hypothetical protein